MPGTRTEPQREYVRWLGREIKKHRALARMSQEKVAQKADVSRETVRRLEAGEALPDLFTLQRVAEVIRLDVLAVFKRLPGQASIGYFTQVRRGLRVPASGVPSPRRRRERVPQAAVA